MIATRIGERALLRSCALAFATAAVTGALAPDARGAPAIDSARGAEALPLAQTFLRGGQLPDAASTADRLLNEPDNGRELLAEASIVRGRAAARLGDALGAEAQFRRALELRPSAGAGAAGQAIVGGAADPRAAALVIPGAELVAGTHVEYDVRALNAPGSVLAESGTPTLPSRLQVAAPASAARGNSASAPAHTPWFKRWWVWMIVGAVALVGGVAAYAGTRGDSLTTYMTQTKQ